MSGLNAPSSGWGYIQMWNSTEVPFACLITFRCYARWLHGDERGSVDRFHNQYKSPYFSANETRQKTTQLFALARN